MTPKEKTHATRFDGQTWSHVISSSQLLQENDEKKDKRFNNIYVYLSIFSHSAYLISGRRKCFCILEIISMECSTVLCVVIC